MKKIVFLTPTLPFPPVSGGVIKSYKVVQFLSTQYEVTVACLLKNEDEQHVDSFLKTVNINPIITATCNIPR
ncbi:MAG TPA: hypothetical protein PLZ64_07730, partial [Chitinophagales bacterium]|nr:hypothetical protein [Chitinophagales bacterium]